jgi:hypothetical protein
MKQTILYTLIVIFSGLSHTSCSRSEARKENVVMLHTTVDDPGPLFYKIGDIPAGSWTELRLNLKNTRKTPVVISEARTFCGCTIPRFESGPVLPGEYAVIKVTFVAEYTGIFDKVVRIFLNDRTEPFELRLTGTVTRKKKS